MAPKSYSAEYPGAEVQKLTLNNVQDALHSEDWSRVCKEIGAFIEIVAVARYTEFQHTRPKNLRVAIDFIMDNDLIARPLGAKMHLVRELRNIEAHRLPYLITKDDAGISRQILADVISWMHGDKLRESWNRIVEVLESGERSNRFLGPRATLRNMYSALDQAVDLKLYSLSIPSKPPYDLISRIERLIDQGIDLRSSAWRNLVAIRNAELHSKPGQFDAEWVHLLSQYSELREILFRLQPTFGPLKV